MTTEQTFVVVGASLAGAKAAETLRTEGFDGRLVLIGSQHERPYERRRCPGTTCAAGPGGRRSTSTRGLLRRAGHRPAPRSHGHEREHVRGRADPRRRRAGALRPAAAHHGGGAAPAPDSGR